jgi:hypothetical protein
VPALLQWCERASPDQNVGCFPDALRKQTRPEDVPAILEHARARRKSARGAGLAEVLQVLANAGQPAPDTPATLATLLKDTDAGTRLAALRAVVALGEDGAALEQPLRDLLRDRHEVVVQLALWALSRVTPGTDALFDTLKEHLLTPGRMGRWSVPHLLAEYGKRSVPVLVAGLAHEDVREICLAQLRGLRRDAAEALPELEALLASRPKDAQLAHTIATIRGEAKKE